MPDCHSRAGRNALQQKVHVLRRNGDTACRWRVGLTRNVKEDGAAASLYGRKHVAVQHHDDVVEPVVPPHFFVTCRKRTCDRAIVKTMPGVVAPACIGRQRFERQNRPGRAAPVRSVKDMQQLERTQWRCPVTFFLAADHARSPESTRNRDRTKPDYSLGPVARQRTYFQYFRRFARIKHDVGSRPAIAD